MSSRVIAAVCVALALVLVGCGQHDAAEGSAPAPQDAFTVATVAGGQLSAGDLEGGDVALWFWAPW